MEIKCCCSPLCYSILHQWKYMICFITTVFASPLQRIVLHINVFTGTAESYQINGSCHCIRNGREYTPSYIIISLMIVTVGSSENLHQMLLLQKPMEQYDVVNQQCFDIGTCLFSSYLVGKPGQYDFSTLFSIICITLTFVVKLLLPKAPKIGSLGLV